MNKNNIAVFIDELKSYDIMDKYYLKINLLLSKYYIKVGCNILLKKVIF